MHHGDLKSTLFKLIMGFEVNMDKKTLQIIETTLEGIDHLSLPSLGNSVLVLVTDEGVAPGTLYHYDGTDLVPYIPAQKQVIQFAVSDEVTAITTGTDKISFRMPSSFTLTSIKASLSIAQTSGTIIFTVDVLKNGTTILSTKITIDNTETSSVTATTPAVISETSFVDDDLITVNIDQIGDGTAKGLKLTMVGFFL